MGKARLSDTLQKHNFLYSDRTSDEARNAAADDLIDRERFGEALEFLEITGDPSRLARIEKQAVSRGDTFLLGRLEKIRGERLSDAVWRRTGEKAVQTARYYDAYRALLHVGDEDAAEAVRAEHMPDYEPFRPEGK